MIILCSIGHSGSSDTARFKFFKLIINNDVVGDNITFIIYIYIYEKLGRKKKVSSLLTKCAIDYQTKTSEQLMLMLRIKVT